MFNAKRFCYNSSNCNCRSNTLSSGSGNILRKTYWDNAVVEYHGGIKDADRSDAIEQFQDIVSSSRFFVGNPQTGGMGITLTASSTVIYYSNTYNLEDRIQSEDRAHRIGQTNKVTYVDLICRKTVDEKIVPSLINKKSIAANVLGDQWKDWI